MPGAAARHAFAAGFRALLPLWLGALPIGIAYAVAARSAGLSAAQTQLMSLTLFSAGAQLSAVSLLHAGATLLELIANAAVLNLHQLLLGFSLGRRIPLTCIERALAAYGLNDGAYAAAMAAQHPSFAFLLGAELSMFIVWNGATALGLLAGQLLPDPARLGADFVFPLIFLALLVPLLRSRADLLAACAAGMCALLVGRVAPSSIAVLGAAIAGSAVVACFPRARMQK